MDKPNDLRTALITLRELITSGNPPMEHGGICSWLRRNSNIEAEDEMHRLFVKWPNTRICQNDQGVWIHTLHPLVHRDKFKYDYSNRIQWSNPTRVGFIDWAIDHLTNN
jgi:hypothetical protein